MNDRDTPTTTGPGLTSTTVRVASEHGTVTVFGPATMVANPPVSDGRIRVVLHYDSRSLFSWWTKYSQDAYVLDMWAPVPLSYQRRGTLPWLRVTVSNLELETNQSQAGGGYVAVGWASREVRHGEVLRYRHVTTRPDSEEPPGGSW